MAVVLRQRSNRCVGARGTAMSDVVHALSHMADLLLHSFVYFLCSFVFFSSFVSHSIDSHIGNFTFRKYVRYDEWSDWIAPRRCGQDDFGIIKSIGDWFSGGNSTAGHHVAWRMSYSIAKTWLEQPAAVFRCLFMMLVSPHSPADIFCSDFANVLKCKIDPASPFDWCRFFTFWQDASTGKWRDGFWDDDFEKESRRIVKMVADSKTISEWSGRFWMQNACSKQELRVSWAIFLKRESMKSAMRPKSEFESVANGSWTEIPRRSLEFVSARFRWNREILSSFHFQEHCRFFRNKSEVSSQSKTQFQRRGGLHHNPLLDFPKIK